MLRWCAAPTRQQSKDAATIYGRVRGSARPFPGKNMALLMGLTAGHGRKNLKQLQRYCSPGPSELVQKLG